MPWNKTIYEEITPHSQPQHAPAMYGKTLCGYIGGNSIPLHGRILRENSTIISPKQGMLKQELRETEKRKRARDPQAALTPSPIALI